MKCQILFDGKTKKNIINLSSSELALGLVKSCLNSSITVTVWYAVHFAFCFVFECHVFLGRLFTIEPKYTYTLISLRLLST